MPAMPYKINTIVTGDAKGLCSLLPNESIDLIACDPIYNKLDDYAWLADLAIRVLRPGRSIIAQAGSLYRYEAETVMRAAGLTPRPLLIEVLMGGGSKLWQSRAFQRYKEHLWFSKGDRPKHSHFVQTLVSGGGRQKRFHQWGDSPLAMRTWIEQLTEPGDLVLDPFAGGGMVSRACIESGRNFLAFEIDPRIAKSARKSIEQTRSPMFVVVGEQLRLPNEI